MTTRAMLEELGIRVVDVEGLCDAAVYIEDVHVLLVRPEISSKDLESAAQSVLLSEEATA